MLEMLCEQAQRHFGRVAVIVGCRQASCRELADRADQLRNSLWR